MTPDFWHERWQRGDIGFHQPHVHDQLQRLWHELDVRVGGRVFVPLAGKSRDMIWLAEQGHPVTGVELSKIAVEDFFDFPGIQPRVSRDGAFDVWRAGPYTIWQGDVFDLPARALDHVAAVYDRAALIALPADMRTRYALKLAEIVPVFAPMFVIAIDYNAGEITGPPFSVPEADVLALFSDHFDVAVLERRDGLAASENLKKRGVTRMEETAYLLRRRA